QPLRHHPGHLPRAPGRADVHPGRGPRSSAARRRDDRLHPDHHPRGRRPGVPVSAAIVGNTGLSRFDAIVIGGGAGGGAVANMLCAKGLSVLILEAGPNHFDGLDDPKIQPVSRFSNDELKLTNRNFIWPDARVEPRTWRTTEADGDRTYVGDVNA